MTASRFRRYTTTGMLGCQPDRHVLMIGGDAAAQGMATIPIFIITLGLIGSGVWLLGSTLPGFLSVLLLLYLPVIRGTLGYAYIENGLALFSWGATLAL